MSHQPAHIMDENSLIATEEDRGARIDRVLAPHAAGASRSEVQRWIREGRVRVDGDVVRQPSHRLKPGQDLTWTPPVLELLTPRSLPLRILYEDNDLLAVDKPVGLVVHPGAGTAGTTTLVEALLADRRLPASDDPCRPGIVHRIDKETSGVLVVAKSAEAYNSLKEQFLHRRVEKRYLAAVAGAIEEDEGWIDAPIGRDPRAPRRMAVVAEGREAQTGFRVLRREGGQAVLLLQPRTGRTHQIRVHCRYIGHPVVGDALYGGPKADRLALHAWMLALRHPTLGKRVVLEAPPPANLFLPSDYEPWRMSIAADQA